MLATVDVIFGKLRITEVVARDFRDKLSSVNAPSVAPYYLEGL